LLHDQHHRECQTAEQHQVLGSIAEEHFQRDEIHGLASTSTDQIRKG
jgi:hypothetical protein